MEPRGEELRFPLRTEQVLKILGEPAGGTIPEQPISSISTDHRQLPADLFVAISGTSFDATQVIEKAMAAGARGVVAERGFPDGFDSTVPWWHVKDARWALAHLQQAGAGSPGESLRVYGITGTNGKSTTVQYLASILESAGRSVGWMTTVENRIGSEIETSHMTTPGPARIADALARHQQSGGTDMILEISSHAIDQHRVAGVPLVAGAITSLGRDHLDYHKTLENYHATKLKLRNLCTSEGPFLTPLNKEDPHQVGFRVSRSSAGDQQVTAEILESDFSGIRARIRSIHFETEIQIPQPGIHNLSNALCAIALADACHFPEAVIIAGIENAAGVPGRLQPIVGSIGQIFIDFAHTPDAIEAVLQTIKPLVKGQLLVLFGCGGDRDRGKRPEMGAAVARYADRIIVTSDNPRSEPPGDIVEQVLAGIPQVNGRVVREIDRREAISKALAMLTADDVLIIAGKGHEKTQEIDGVKLPFCDVKVVHEFLGLDSVSTENGEELIR